MGTFSNDIPLKPRFELALRTAREFLIDEEISSLPIDSIKLAEKLDLGPIPFSKVGLPMHWDGFIQSLKGTELIFYNDYQSVCHQRTQWTVMHEIGHSRLGHLNYDDVLFVNEAMPSEKYDILEVEAHYFASEVLAPTAVLQALHIQSHTKIMELCGLSEEAARKRKERFDHCDQWGKFHELDQQILEQFSDFIKRYSLCY